MEEEVDEAREQGQGPPLPRVIPPSQLSKRHSMIISMQLELQNKQVITRRLLIISSCTSERHTKMVEILLT